MGQSAAVSSQLSQASLPSNLFPMLFEKLRLSERLVVLDMGLASAASVNFFGQTKCRLQFTGLIEPEIEKYNDQELKDKMPQLQNLGIKVERVVKEHTRLLKMKRTEDISESE